MLESCVVHSPRPQPMALPASPGSQWDRSTLLCPFCSPRKNFVKGFVFPSLANWAWSHCFFRSHFLSHPTPNVHGTSPTKLHPAASSTWALLSDGSVTKHPDRPGSHDPASLGKHFQSRRRHSPGSLGLCLLSLRPMHRPLACSAQVAALLGSGKLPLL